MRILTTGFLPISLSTLLIYLFCTVAFAQTGNNKEKEYADFFDRHKDYQKTLQLERDFHQALIKRNQRWIDDKAELFIANDYSYVKPPKAEVSKEEKEAYSEFSVKLGPCEYASISLHGAIVSRSEEVIPKKLPRKIDSLIPENFRELFSENIRRCEVIKKYPRTKRLIGEDIPY